MNDHNKVSLLIQAAKTFITNHDAQTFFAKIRDVGSRPDVTQLIEEISQGQHGSVEMPELASLIMIKKSADKIW